MWVSSLACGNPRDRWKLGDPSIAVGEGMGRGPQLKREGGPNGGANCFVGIDAEEAAFLVEEKS